MPDIQAEINEIQDFLNSNSNTTQERMKQASSAYAQACQDANRRLVQCSQLINKGLRSEAIHQARTEPNLLELVAQLEFAGAERWPAHASSYGLTVPPRVNMKAAQDLNQAYAQEQPLDELMRKHRLLALSKGSLRSRLVVIRRIASLDAGNFVWHDDIREYERARFTEIASEFQSAAKRNDVEKLQDLNDEANDRDWLEKLPGDLAQRISQRAENDHRAILQKRLTRYEASMTDAQAIMDVPTALALRREILDLVASEELDASDPLLVGVTPGVNWAAKQEKAEKKRADVERRIDALRAGVSGRLKLPELRQLYGDTGDCSDEVPDELHSAMAARESQFRNRQTLRLCLRVGAVFTVLIVAAVLVMQWNDRQDKRARVAAAKQAFAKLVDEGDEANIRAHIEKLKKTQADILPEMNHEPVLRKLDEAEKKRNDRAAQFEDEYEKAQNIPVGDPRELPAAAILSRLAGSETDKVMALRYASEREAFRRKQTDLAREKVAGAVQEQLNAFEQTFAGINVATYNRDKLDAAQRQIDDLKTKIDKLEKESGSVGTPLKIALQALEERLDRQGETIDRYKKEVNACENVTAALRGRTHEMEKYRAAVRQGAALMSDASRKAAFESMEAESKYWEMVLYWEKLLGEASGDYLLLRNPKAAEVRAKALNEWSQNALKMLEVSESTLGLSLVVEYITSLNATAARETVLEELRELFNRADVRGLHVVVTTDSGAYYLTRDPTKAVIGRKDDINFLVRRYGQDSDVGILGKKYSSHDQAPQSIIADTIVLRDVPDIDIKGLDQAIMRIVNERIRLQPGMDPILTVILIQKVLDAAAKGDTALAAELEESIKMIAEAKKGGLDLSVPWHDPTRKDADKVRVTARKFMVGFPGLKDVAAKAQERREKLSKQLTASRHQFLGWMYQDPEAGWQVVAMQPQLKTRPIQTLEFQDGKPLGWTTIGEVNPAGAVTLRPEAKSALKDGRLVFVPVE